MNDKLVKTSLVFAAALATALPALAESSAASSASQSVSTSIGSLSTSLQGSSGSSKADKVAAGDYRLIEIAELADRPGMLRLRLQAIATAATAGADEFFLLLPREAAQNGRLAEGKIVTAQTRPYGLEFAAADTKTAFFLVLDDGWHRELDSRPVVL